MFHILCTLSETLAGRALSVGDGSWWFGLEIDPFHLVPQRMTGLRQGKMKETKECWNSNCSWRMTLRSSNRHSPKNGGEPGHKMLGRRIAEKKLLLTPCWKLFLWLAFGYFCYYVCVCVCVLGHFSHIRLCDPMNCSSPGSSVYGILQGKNTGVDYHDFLQGIFPTQEWKLFIGRWGLHH